MYKTSVSLVFSVMDSIIVKNVGNVVFDYIDIRSEEHYYLVNGEITKSEDVMKMFREYISHTEKHKTNDVLEFISKMKKTAEHYCIVQEYMSKQGYRVVGPYKDYNKALLVYYSMHIPNHNFVEEDPYNENWD